MALTEAFGPTIYTEANGRLDSTVATDGHLDGGFAISLAQNRILTGATVSRSVRRPAAPWRTRG